MENAEEIYHFLEDFSKRKPKVIPQELNDYLSYVARTGDPVYQWSLVKSLFKEKLLNVITDFYETTPGLEIPPYPNVDPFNYDTMKNSLLERLDSFNSAPFTVQRICELLTFPRKQYNRIDKFMRAIEKNILVVSTREPGVQRPAELDNGEPGLIEPIVNGSDNSEYNLDVEMEDMSWKENEQNHASEPQPSSSDSHISVDDAEVRLEAKEDTPMDLLEKASTDFESAPPTEATAVTEETEMKAKEDETPPLASVSADIDPVKLTETQTKSEDADPLETEAAKVDVEMKTEEPKEVVIPEIKVDDAETTEQRLNDEQNNKTDDTVQKVKEAIPGEKQVTPEPKVETQPTIAGSDESSSDSNTKEESPKLVCEVPTSSEESSSSSDNTDGNSNSPKTDIEAHIDSHEDMTPVPETQERIKTDQEVEATETELLKDPEQEKEPSKTVDTNIESVSHATLESDNYSVADVQSELPQPIAEEEKKEKQEVKVGVLVDIEEPPEEQKVESIEVAENKE